MLRHFPAKSIRYFTYVATQSKNVLYQNCAFCGFSTQCPSSGKTTSFDGTPCRCSALKNSSDCLYGTRQSLSPAITSRGVLNFPSSPPYVTGAHFFDLSAFDPGVPFRSC